VNNSFNPFVVLSKQQKKNAMKKIKTTAEQRQIGKKCNCFYKGKIYPCEVIGFKGKNIYSVCRIDELGMEVNVRSTLVNWTDDPQVEEIWLDDYEEKKDRTERLRETRTAMQQVVRDSISANRKEVDCHSKDKKRGTIDPKQLILLNHRMKSLCGVGSRAVFQLLNVLCRSGEESSKLYKLALEIEKMALSCYQYDGQSMNGYNWKKRTEWVIELMEICKGQGIPFGHPQRNMDVVCFKFPGCETIAFPVKEWKIETGVIPRFNHEWNGKCLMNIRRLENAIIEKYGWYLRVKYPDRFA